MVRFETHSAGAIAPTQPGAEILGSSRAISELRDQIAAIAGRNCTVLIHGETGVGKELVARRVHALSRRANRPFVPVDCTTLPASLFESQLFGHARGAFTGAERPTLGFLRAADGGTLFLAELGELPPSVQAKLLRAIQERAVVPVGEVRAVPVDVRLVGATHRDLRAMVRRGEFREDLFYRLNVVALSAPPLRDRREDVLPLAEHFLRQLGELYGEPVKRLSIEAEAALLAYEWPGNVRELQNAIEHCSAFCHGMRIVPADLPSTLRAEVLAAPDSSAAVILPLMEAERRLIVRALEASGGNQAQAARLLQIERHRLSRKIRLHGLKTLILRH
jgi:DNA-binding NtrC family response regulator